MQNATSRVWGEGPFSLVCVSLLHFFISCKKIIFSLLSSNIYWKSQKNAIYMNHIVWVWMVWDTICLKSACCTTTQLSAERFLPAVVRVRPVGGQPFSDTNSRATTSNLSSPHLEEVTCINEMHTWYSRHNFSWPIFSTPVTDLRNHLYSWRQPNNTQGFGMPKVKEKI